MSEYYIRILLLYICKQKHYDLAVYSFLLIKGVMYRENPNI